MADIELVAARKFPFKGSHQLVFGNTGGIRYCLVDVALLSKGQLTVRPGNRQGTVLFICE